MAFLQKRKIRRGRRIRRGKMPLKNMIKKEINKTLNKRVETKDFYYSNAAQNNAYTSISYNIFYHSVNQGSSPNMLIGQSLNWRGIKLKYRVTNQYPSGTTLVFTNQPIYVDIMLVESDIYKTTTSLSLSEIYNNPLLPENGFLIKGTKILAKKTVTILGDRGQTAGQECIKSGSIWIRRNQKLEYMRALSFGHELTRKNYYVVIVPRCNWTTGACCTVDFSYKNYFQDM